MYYSFLKRKKSLSVPFRKYLLRQCLMHHQPVFFALCFRVFSACLCGSLFFFYQSRDSTALQYLRRCPALEYLSVVGGRAGGPITLLSDQTLPVQRAVGRQNGFSLRLDLLYIRCHGWQGGPFRDED